MKDSKGNTIGQKKIISMYFQEDIDHESDPYFTGLSFITEDGNTVKQYSSDILKPYGIVKSESEK